MKVIILNGPMGSGKDTIANLLVEMLGAHNIPAVRWEFKQALWEAVADHYKLGDVAIRHLKEVHDNRNLKEKPQALLGGLSTRGALIHVSENVYKPKYGKDVFGWHSAAALADLQAAEYKLAIGSDGGFPEELKPVAAGFETHVFRLMGRGTFEGDSRRYLTYEEAGEAGAHSITDIHLQEGEPQLAVAAILSQLAHYPG